MKIGFTGTRHGMTDKQYNAVNDLVNHYVIYDDVDEFHHGDCNGADEEAHGIALRFNLFTVVHPPSLTTLRAYCQGDLVLPTKDYEQRNRDIVQASDLVIAAPPTDTEQPFGGTWQTVRLSREYNKPCKIVLSSGIVVDA